MFRKIKRTPKRNLRVHTSSDDINDSDFYRCKVCGFVCKKSKTQVLGYEPNRTTFTDGVEYTYDGSDVDTVNVTRGCPLCGTFYSR
jgi:hypothetical protein